MLEPMEHGTGLRAVDVADTRAVLAGDLHRICVFWVGWLVPKEHRFVFGKIKYIFAIMPVSRDIEDVAEGVIKSIESLGDTEAAAT